MKICIDAREFSGNHKTGISRYLENIIAAIAFQSDWKTILFVYNKKSVPDLLLNSKIRIIELPTAPKLFMDHIILPKIANMEKADVFFSPYYKTPLYGNFKRIITVHDIMFLRLPLISPIRRFFADIQLRLSVNKADTVLVDSDFTRQDLISLIPKAVNKVIVLYPSLESYWRDPLPPESVRDISNKYTNGKPFFLYAGNFKKHKNINTLVQAFIEFKSSEKVKSDIILLLVGGDSHNISAIKNLIQSKGGESHIQIYTDIDDTALRSLYSAAEWYISLSQYEGFGYPFIEAMVSGCPVIACPCTSIPEITNSNILPVKHVNIQEICRVLQQASCMNLSQKEEIIKNGKAHAFNFTSQNPSELFLSKILNSYNK